MSAMRRRSSTPVLYELMKRDDRSRHPQVQMPPIGTRQPDLEGQALIDRWINQLASPNQEKSP